MVQTYDFPGSPRDPSIFQTIEAEFVKKHCSTAEEIILAARDADAIITLFPRQSFPRNILAKLPKCRVIASYSNGYENIDLDAATEFGICACNVPDASVEEVSDQAMALLLACAKKVCQFDKSIRAGDWDSAMRPKIMAMGQSILRIKGQVLGLLGFGRIARTLVPKARGFGLKIIIHDPYVSKSTVAEYGVEMVDIDTLFRTSDYISIHTALTPQSRHLVGIELLKKMKPTAYLINTARGAIIDEKALCTALSKGYIAGAGLDAFETEPPDIHSPLFSMSNVVLSPHVGALSISSMAEIQQRPAEEVIRVLKGEWPRNLLNPAVKDNYVKKWGKSA